MNIPHWAPEGLVSVWKELAEPSVAVPDELQDVLSRFPYMRVMAIVRPQHKDENVKLLGRFLTDERMRSIWKSLSRREQAIGDGGVTGSLPAYDVMLYIQVQKFGESWDEEPKDTAKEKVEHCRRIFEQARALGLSLQSSGHVDVDVDELLRTDEMACLVDAVAGEEAYADRQRGHDPRLFRVVTQGTLPPLSLLLRRLMQLAELEAAIPVAVKQPNSKNAKVHFYVRETSGYFRRTYGQPLHELVATVVSVALEVDIDEGTVRGLVKDWFDRSNAAEKRAKMQDSW